jgi:CO/xanthine dehydrogenase Mo-binding subunit
MPDVFKGRNQDRKEFKIVGKRGIPGRQSFAQATGLAKYPRDILIPNMLHAKILRSPYAHARIKSMDISAAEKLPGVKGMIRWDDPEIKAIGNAAFGYTGQAVFTGTADREGEDVGVCVAAESEEICDEALRLVKVEWEILPHILDPREAIKPGAPILNPDVDPKTNVCEVIAWEDGDVAAGFAAADHIAEFDFSDVRGAHHRANPNTNIAYWEEDPTGTEGKTLVVDTGMQLQRCGPSYTARAALNLSWDKVHVLTPYWGGKYCGSISQRGEVLAPLLAKKTGRPVRMAYSRRDDFDTGWPQGYSHVKIGFNKDGVIVAAHGQTIGDYGTKGGNTSSIPTMTTFRTTKCKNIKNENQTTFTNTARNRPKPGGCYMHLLSKSIWVIADKLGMDPTEVALKNCHTPEPSLKACIENGKKAMGWQWHAAGTKKLANGRMHGYGFRYGEIRIGTLTQTVALSMRDDGKIYMPHQEALLGTHWEDAVAMVIAEETGAKIDDVVVHFVPNIPSWMEGTSRARGPNTTWVAKEAAIDLKAALLKAAAASLKVTPEELDTNESTVYLKADPTKTYPFKRFSDVNNSTLAASFTGSAPPYQGPKTLTTLNTVFCEVEVDTETGELEITKWVVACDAGKVLRPSSYEGQIENPMIFNTGFAMREEAIWDKATGVRLNASTLGYGPSTILDIPPIVMPTVETRLESGCYGATTQAHSLGDTITASLAVYNAIGKWIDEPITPDKVLKALGKI